MRNYFLFLCVSAVEGFEPRTRYNLTDQLPACSYLDILFHSFKYKEMDCTVLDVPESQGFSGGWCLAAMGEAGWLRSTALNPVMNIMLATHEPESILPVLTGTNSVGSMFMSRYFALRHFPSSTKWNYPCYQLTPQFTVICYFHNDFGDISNDCLMEKYNVICAAGAMVYGPMMMAYGGPLGVASSFLSTWLPFLSDLQLRRGLLGFSAFSDKFLLWNSRHNVISNWLVALTISNPRAASAEKEPYNYGFDSYLSRGLIAKASETLWHSNRTLPEVCTWSANTLTGFSIFPFAFGGKAWDGMSMSNPGSPAMKVFAMTLSYTMIKKLILQHTVLGVREAPKCENDCPVFDGGFTDNGPITPMIASASQMPAREKPVWLSSVGASSTMSTVKYLMGSGPLDIWTFAGINLCPFTLAQICTVLSKVRQLVAGIMPQDSERAFMELTNTFGVYRPAVKLFEPYCGDPLAYDMFNGQCGADSVCEMWTTIMPSEMNEIQFDMYVYTIVFVMIFLNASPVSERFVNAFMPGLVWDLNYYEHMDEWFPNFSAIALQKGGIGFTKIAGNSMMDYMTYLNVRLVGFIFRSKEEGLDIMRGMVLNCDYFTYEMVNRFTYDSASFREMAVYKSLAEDRANTYRPPSSSLMVPPLLRLPPQSVMGTSIGGLTSNADAHLSPGVVDR